VCAVPVIFNEHVPNHVNSGKIVILDAAVRKKAGADSQKRDVKGPDIPQWCLNPVKQFSTNQLVRKVGAPVKREKAIHKAANPLPKRRGQNEEESNIREEGNNKNIHVKDA